LVGRLTSLSRFLPRVIEKIRPILKVLKKANRFKWDDKCKEAFNEIKADVSSTPILEKHKARGRFLLYLSVLEDAISSTLIHEEEYKPVYFTGRTLYDPETMYQVIEKVALALVYTAKQLRPYFQGHPIIVKTDDPMGKVFLRPDLVKRMISWSIELLEFDLTFKPSVLIRVQCLADFISKLQGLAENAPGKEQETWTLYVDGASNKKGCGAGMVLENLNGVRLEQSLCFAFKASNNQVEYEALITG